MSTGSLPVIRRVHIVSMQRKWMVFTVKQGGTAEVELLSLEDKSFF